MKRKEPKFEYGIEITRPWNRAMYDHNDRVAALVRDIVKGMWEFEFSKAEQEFIEFLDEDQDGLQFSDQEYEHGATEELVRIQKAVTLYSIGFGYNMQDIEDEVIREIEDAPYFRLNEIVDELGIELAEGFVGFN